MKNLGSALITKSLAGLIVLVPIAILTLAALEIYDLLEDMAVIQGIQLPFPPAVNALIFIALGLLGLLLTCLLMGLLMDTGPGKKLGQFLQDKIIEKIPLLGLARNLALSLTGSRDSGLKPAEIDLQGGGTTFRLGFLTEVLPDGRYVVFIPSAPAVTMGQTFIVQAEQVRLLDVPITTVVNALTQWGVGASDIYKSP